MATGNICVIRDARPDDCEEILSMIEELVHHDFKVSDQVRLDANTIRRDGFGPSKLFHCSVAEDKTSGGKLVGYALYLFHYCFQEGRYLYGKNVFVDPDYRLLRIGDRLMREIAKFAVQNRCKAMIWNSYIWKKEQVAASERIGGENYTKSEDATPFRLYEEQIRKLVNSPMAIDETFLIRKARPEDGEEVLTLVKELSVLKKHSTNAITIDADTFRRDGFGQEKLFHCFVAETRGSVGKLMGYALYVLHYGYLGISTFIEDICISPKHRQIGVEGRLLREVAKEAVETGFMPLDFVGDDSDKDTMAFLESICAINRTISEGIIRMRLRGENLINYAADQSKL